MRLIFLVPLLAMGCASQPPPAETGRDTASEEVELQPLGDGKKVCGWSDAGRWVCEDPGKKKKKSGKFTTKFKKGGPPKPVESQLPRGDTPVSLDPIDESGDGASSSKDDPGGG